MSLTEYKKKRVFGKTPEPTGGKPVDKKLRFVVQKHHASHLHYDFRLELRGVLKSWAVPKGLSTDPSESRLAMLVEDHPWDYRNFEGVIPSGYGAGTVIVWDEGTYDTPEGESKEKKMQEHSITSQFWKGHINFSLHGHKLKGAFTIARAKDKDDNAWYIHKVKDKYSSKSDITLKDRSVKSGKTLEQMAASPQNEWQSHKPAKAKKAIAPQIKRAEIQGGKKSPMPESVKPMLCTLIKEPFSDPGWLYEVKWDGYRIIAFSRGSEVTLQSRGNQDYSLKYLPITEAIHALKINAVLDGEVVVLNDEGQPDFSALQNYKTGDTIAFYVFDIIWCNGSDVMDLPLIERKELLNNVVEFNDIIRYSESFDDGLALFDTARQLGIEGIVAKKRDSVYTPGKKGDTWFKAKFSLRKEYVIGGWTESKNGRLFRSLIFGHYVKGKLMYVHHSGGGFNDKQMRELSSKLKKLEIDTSPFYNKVVCKTKEHWAKPILVGEFEQSDKVTTAGKIRHPAIFIGLRDDKKASDVIEEIAEEAPGLKKKVTGELKKGAPLKIADAQDSGS